MTRKLLMSEISQEPLPVAATTLTFTGERRKKQYQIIVNERPAMAALTAFTALVDLVIARGSPGTGYRELASVDVQRLRKILGAAMGKGFGMELIETGVRKEYRLCIPDNRLSAQVVLTASFFELEELGVISHVQMAALRQFCTVVKSR